MNIVNEEILYFNTQLHLDLNLFLQFSGEILAVLLNRLVL